MLAGCRCVCSIIWIADNAAWSDGLKPHLLTPACGTERQFVAAHQVGGD
jgi:hypothetical protein